MQWPPDPHGVPKGANWFGGQKADEPVQVSATSHGPADARHITFDDANWSGGQTRDTPSQNSATSQTPACCLHVTPADRGEHVPVAHVPQPPPHEELQQTPLTQNPEAHCEGLVHG